MRTEAALQVFIENMKDVYTMIPGHVTAFDASTQRAQLQIGVLVYDLDNKPNKPTPIVECPVHFSGGGGWSIDHELSAGDEGAIFFSQRCVDGWMQTGGIAENPIARFHDAQDAFFIPGFRSLPNAISDFKNDGIRLRNKQANVYIWLKDDGTIELKNSSSTVTQEPSGQVELKNSAGFIRLLPDGSVNINGFTISPSGLASDSQGIGFATHTHSQGNDSGGNSQVETDAPTTGT